jgi:hypothetical protein
MNRASHLITLLLASSIAMLPMTSASLAGKDARSKMTPAQKKELRKRGREWCMKNHIKGNMQFERIEIMSDGRIRCWMRG